MNMKIILCMLIDKHGHIKYQPLSFKPKEADICVSNFIMGSLGNKSLYYTLLDYEEEYAEDICWTTHEVLDRCEKYKENGVVKIFTRIQDFYNHADEIQFAYQDELETWDEELETKDLIEFCKTMDKKFLGELNNVKFFRYTKKNI